MDTTIRTHVIISTIIMFYNNGKHTYDLFEYHDTLFAYLTLKDEITTIHTHNYSFV